MSRALPRLLIAAPASGAGKTTLTCGLLRLLASDGLRPAALKCGPDYIDPQFHRRLTGAASGNLDAYFTDAPTCAALLARAAQGCEVAVLEGAMGYYDGVVGAGTTGSAYEVARATETPVVLVVGARGASLTLAATIRGIATFRPDARIAGVILNGCAPALCERLRPELEREAGVPVLGCVPRDERFSLPSRHLGLVSPADVADLSERIDGLAATLRQTLDVDALLEIARSAPNLVVKPYTTSCITDARPRIAVARDAAFSFYYEENLRMLADLGAELAFFSPLADEALPAGTCGLYLGGGYPELHARELASNAAMRSAARTLARAAMAGGAPVLAECGGFMYLLDELVDEGDAAWPMAGALPGVARREGRLRHFGYVELTTREPSLLGPAGTRVRAHEFHYWHATDEGASCVAAKPTGAASWPCLVARGNLLAGYPHVFFPAHPALAERFVRAAATSRGNAGSGALPAGSEACCLPCDGGRSEGGRP